jgi:hypothetical protein
MSRYPDPRKKVAVEGPVSTACRQYPGWSTLGPSAFFLPIAKGRSWHRVRV